MLQNRIYRGEIVHKDRPIPGEHEAIVDETLWDEVQAALVRKPRRARRAASGSSPSLLAGLIYDDAGERMTPTHANKKGTRYRYYVSQSLIRHGRPQASRRGVPGPGGGPREHRGELGSATGCGTKRPSSSAAGATTVHIGMRKTMIEQCCRSRHDDGRRCRPPKSERSCSILVERMDVRRETVEVYSGPQG